MEKKIHISTKSSLWDRGIKWSVYCIAGFFLLLLLCYIILSANASKKLIGVYNTQLQQVEINRKQQYSDSIHPSVTGLIGRKAFLESQLNLLNSDSVNLVIDLKDSVISLVLEGVTIHTSVISDYDLSRFFGALSNEAYIHIFSKPFVVENYKSSIVKEPITLKEAPKDTLEAASFFEMPDTTINGFVAVNMSLSQGFILTLRQQEEITRSVSRNDRFFFLALRLQKVKTDFRRLFHFRLPAYEPAINIALPKDELVTLFRALPGSAKVAIRIR